MRRRSWRSSNDNGGTAAAMLVAVIATLLLAANWAALPCAAQQCTTLADGILAEVSSTGLTDLGAMGPTVAQRVRIGSNPIVISNILFTLSSCTYILPPPSV
jgi:ascorbate-specific PTS system EIIC-type component UlaA